MGLKASVSLRAPVIRCKALTPLPALCWFIQPEQGLQQSLTALVANAFEDHSVIAGFLWILPKLGNTS